MASRRSPASANVTVLATGGTIAGNSSASSTTTVGYTAATVPVETLLNSVPEMKKVANLSDEQVFPIASENMNNDHWLKLAKRVNEFLTQDNVGGIVITHRTDTIEEMAYFLNLVVKSRKPVVIVGAMTADAFRTPDLGMLGYMQGNKPFFYRTSVRRNTNDSEFDVSGLTSLPQVDIVYGYANVNWSRCLRDGRGQGHRPCRRRRRQPGQPGDARRASSTCAAAGPARASSPANGEANDDELDFVVSDTLNPQKAPILLMLMLMLTLTWTSNTREIQRLFWTY